MPGHLPRVVGSLAVVFAAYWLYALLLVPFIEPTALAKRATKVSDSDIAVAKKAGTRNEELLAQLFPPEAWQRSKGVMVLETEQAMLLVKDYQTLEDGWVKLQPCSMVFLPAGRPKTSTQARQPVVLNAPAGAMLQFDQGFNLKAAQVGKLVGGQLVGEITVDGAPSRPGADDGLHAVTRDLQLSPDRLWTPHPVHFRMGANNGEGRDMHILLARTNKAEGQRAPIGGIQAFELRRDVRMHLQMGGGLMPGPKKDANDSATTAVGQTKKPESPVEIKCKGAFQFDVVNSVATFHESVDVLRLNPTGPSDQMNCELLSIYFTREQKPTAANVEGVDNRPGPLKPRLIEARGDPVVVRAPSSGGHARCQRLEYDIQLDRISLEGVPDVLLHQGSNQIRTRRIDYQSGDRGELGRLLASGPGSLEGAMPDNPDQHYQARWTRQLHVRPDRGNQVISLLGGAEMHYAAMGGLTAEEIHLWLFESNKPKRAFRNPIQPASYSKPRSNLQADRMLAQGNVRIRSAELSGATGRLEVWFRQILSGQESSEYPEAPSPEPLPGTTIAEAPPRTTSPAPKARSNRAFDLAGALLRVQLAVRDGKAALSRASMEGNASLREIRTARPDDKPLSVKGDQVLLAAADTPETEVTVAGKPAYVEAQGLILRGAKINFQRRENRIWIDGPGRMTLPMDRDLRGRQLPRSETLDVAWQKGMDFNGRTIIFEQSVDARGQHQLLRTEKLTVTLTQHVDFSKPEGQKTRPQVDQIYCAGGVFLENRSFDERGQVSFDQMQSRDLAISQVTGAVDSHGPGWLTSVRRGQAQNLLARPGAPGAPARSEDRRQDQLTYLNVQFEKGITGNLHRREMTFTDQVRTMHGPVADWNDKVQVDEQGRLAADSVLLTCDALTVREMPGPTPNAPGSAELEARGNTLIEGPTFTARAYRMTYEEQKDLLVLEGQGQTDAQIFLQRRPNGQTDETAAGKIMYWPKTKRVEIDRGRFLDLGGFGGPPSADPPVRK